MTTHSTSAAFVPRDLDCSQVDQLEPLYQALLDRPLESAADLQQWLTDYSELDAAIDEYASRRYIAHTCHTDDPAIEQAYLHLVENVVPRLQPLEFKLKQKYVACPHRRELDPACFGVMDRSWQTQVSIYRDENVPLQTQATKLSTQYNKLVAAMQVRFRDRDWTLPQLARFLEQPDRETRRTVWELTEQRRQQDRDAIDAIYDDLVQVRQQIAVNADLSNYRDYIWQSRQRFDYTPQDCLRFGQAVADCCMPIVEKLDQQRQDQLALETLRPWDLAVDPTGKPGLNPFESDQIDLFVDRTQQVLERIAPDFAQQFATLKANGNLDLESRKGKRPGGYQASLEQSGQPFIFMNAAGLHRDVETLLHEAGHAVHYLAAAAAQPLVFHRHAPLEFCEVASMSMELLACDHLDVFYSREDAQRAVRKQLEGIVRILPWIATIDGYQHWVYTHPNHTRQQRTAAWLEVLGRFSSRQVDRSGLDEATAAMWQRQGHLFAAPFYYIEYGIAQLGALQIWLNYQQNPADTLTRLRRAFALGNTRPLPELFEAAGIRFDFGPDTMQPLMDAVQAALV